MRISPLHISAPLALLVTLASCGGDVVPAPSFSLRVYSVGTAMAPAVLLESVDQLEIVIRPQMPARFVELPCATAVEDCGGIQCCKYQNGAIAAFISAAHEYVIRADGAWVRSHADVTAAGFEVVVPLDATSAMDSPGALDPIAFGNVIHGADRIALGAITLRWPLHAGETQGLAVMCAPGFELECMNVDPSIPLDGGP